MLFSETKANSVGRDHLTYSFDGFVLDADRACLSKDGMEIPLRPKSFDVLVYLIKHQGVLVSKDDLMGAIWPDVVVTEDSLTQCLIEIRRALSDKSKTIIRTIPRRGYRFDAPVKIHEPLSNEPKAEPGKGLLSRRRPSAWSAVAIMLLTVAMGITWWTSSRDVSSATADSEARQHFTRGQFFYNRRAEGDIDRAIEQFELATSIDPDLADAWVGLAGAIHVRAYKLGRGLETVAADYFTFIQRALDSDPDHAEAHMRMARYQIQYGSPETVQFHLDRAVENGQNSALVMAMSAGILFYQLRFDEAIELQKRAVELDPLGAINRGNLAYYLQKAGRFHESKTEFLVVFDLLNEPSNIQLYGLADTYLFLHEPTEAESLIQDLPASLEKDRMQAMIYQSMDAPMETQRIIEEIKRVDGVRPAFYLAEIYAFSNLIDDAFHWLSVTAKRHADAGSDWVTNDWLYMNMSSPYLRVLREDTRWAEWMKIMKFDEHNSHYLVLPQEI